MKRRPASPQIPQDEDALAKSVADYLRRAWPAELPWWHTPNGGSRAQVTRTDRRTGKTYRFSPEAQKLKAMGVRAGVADLAFIMPNGQAAFIELKAGDNGLSDEQIDFRRDVIACNCGYAVARSLEEVEQILSRWLAHFDLTLRASVVTRLASPYQPQEARS